MKDVPCCHCGGFFTPSPRHKNQNYCMKPDCRRAKKAAWKREKLRTDPDFKLDQQLSNKKWAKANPDYWKNYRRENPEKTLRNRQLQIIRNRRRSKKSNRESTSDHPVIAKVDSSKSNNITLLGRFWVVPVVAKVDALKVNIYEISKPYLGLQRGTR